MTTVGPLTGIGVLVTRPVEQAMRLMARLQELGAAPALFPALAIQPPAHSQDLHAVLTRVDQYDLHLFVSPTAVQFGLAALPSGAVAGLHAAAIGNGTAAALRAGGAENIIAPGGGADSEHLLALPEFAHLAGQRVLIFRGEGGRELIADTLRARGAEVDYAECYRRACPQADPAPLLQAFAQRRIQAVTVFSGETLDNLLHLLGAAGAGYARALPLFVPHARIAQHAAAQNFTQVITTAPGEDGVLAGLVEYFNHA
jgi:uroporphyrinogen-III synthase